MLQFVPPKNIRRIHSSYDLSPDEISPEMYREVREKFKALSSEEPLVSVVVIAYNEERNLFKTLASLCETRSRYPMEFIVVNNNSTDRTQEIIDECGVVPVFEQQRGFSAARQAGLQTTRGKYVVTGDADTLYPPDWVELMIRPFECDPEVVCTYGVHAFYTRDNRYPVSVLAYQQAKNMGIHFRHFRRPQLNCGGASMAFRARVAKQVGGYNLRVGRGEDGYLALQMKEFGKIERVSDKKAYIYTSMRRTEQDGSLMRAFMKRAGRYSKNLFTYLTEQKEEDKIITGP